MSGLIERDPLIFTNGDLMKMLTEGAVAYVASGVELSIKRNHHMNEIADDASFDSDLADAVIVDFLNFIMAQHGCDLGMYTADLRPSTKETKS